METLSGIASKVNSSVLEYPEPNARIRKRRRMHVARFQINSRPIRFESARPHSFRDGDRLIVAGTMHSGVLNALAYRNVTQGLDGHQSWKMWLITGVLFVSVGLALPAHLLLGDGPQAKNGFGTAIVFFVWPGIFALFGGMAIYVGVRTLNAVKAVRQAVA